MRDPQTIITEMENMTADISKRLMGKDLVTLTSNEFHQKITVEIYALSALADQAEIALGQLDRANPM